VNIADLIIIIIIAAVLFFAVKKVVSNYKNTGCPSGCSECDKCSKKKTK